MLGRSFVAIQSAGGFMKRLFALFYCSFADGAESGRVWRIDDEGFYE